MTLASVPVDIRNPGQVLACMGFLEAAEVLCGGAEGHFEWTAATEQFVLSADGGRNPFEVVLEFLATVKVIELTPLGYVEGGGADRDGDRDEDGTRGESEDVEGGEGLQSATDPSGRVTVPEFPSGEGDRNALPIRLVGGRHSLTVSHWAESRGSSATWLSRNHFKLYSGNRSARRIADQLFRSFTDLWKTQSRPLIADPFGKVVPLGGSFNFDARRAWTGIDAGFSPDQQKKNKMIAGVAGSPVVELLATIGLEHARPHEYETRKVRYAVWGSPLPPMLGRAALAGTDLKVVMRRFAFELALSGKNKVTTFAREEIGQ